MLKLKEWYLSLIMHFFLKILCKAIIFYLETEIFSPEIPQFGQFFFYPFLLFLSDSFIQFNMKIVIIESFV